MDLLQSLWGKEECLILNGVMFAVDFVEKVKPLDQPRPVGTITLTCQKRVRIDDAVPLRKAHLICTCRAIDDMKGVTAIAGEAGMGSDGFVAVTDLANRLQWIAFFDFSNPFVSVRIEKGDVIAENNLDERWQFALVNPSAIRVQVP